MDLYSRSNEARLVKDKQLRVWIKRNVRHRWLASIEPLQNAGDDGTCEEKHKHDGESIGDGEKSLSQTHYRLWKSKERGSESEAKERKRDHQHHNSGPRKLPVEIFERLIHCFNVQSHCGSTTVMNVASPVFAIRSPAAPKKSVCMFYARLRKRSRVTSSRL